MHSKKYASFLPKPHRTCFSKGLFDFHITVTKRHDDFPILSARTYILYAVLSLPVPLGMFRGRAMHEGQSGSVYRADWHSVFSEVIEELLRKYRGRDYGRRYGIYGDVC